MSSICPNVYIRSLHDLARVGKEGLWRKTLELMKEEARKNGEGSGRYKMGLLIVNQIKFRI